MVEDQEAYQKARTHLQFSRTNTSI